MSFGQYGAPGPIGAGAAGGEGGGFFWLSAGLLVAGVSLAGLSAGGVNADKWVRTDWQPERTNAHASAAAAQRATRHGLAAGVRFALMAFSAVATVIEFEVEVIAWV